MKLIFSAIFTAIVATECEVCTTFLAKIDKAIIDEGITDDEGIEKKARAMCKEARDQENRFCYYTGLTADAATTMHKVGEILKKCDQFFRRVQSFVLNLTT